MLHLTSHTQNQYDKLKTALDNNNSEVSNPVISEIAVTNEVTKAEPEINTTQEEIEGYVTVKVLLTDIIPAERIFYRDNQSYFNILLDDNIRKWVCRLHLNRSNSKYLVLNNDNKTTYPLESISDLFKYKTEIIQIAKTFK